MLPGHPPYQSVLLGVSSAANPRAIRRAKHTPHTLGPLDRQCYASGGPIYDPNKGSGQAPPSRPAVLSPWSFMHLLPTPWHQLSPPVSPSAPGQCSVYPRWGSAPRQRQPLHSYRQDLLALRGASRLSPGRLRSPQQLPQVRRPPCSFMQDLLDPKRSLQNQGRLH
ncbi:hypothetical protein NDU88_007336 [Pleurodeles waltl]|uniref:Uncharacterized protein n=1 Tax=Pleurodeles waltl TaxID=8319 RepID=A0AAV7US04_PLEWA|nr:hypothetical protein NDU88_007336 [Pleurodeles waltl]